MSIEVFRVFQVEREEMEEHFSCCIVVAVLAR